MLVSGGEHVLEGIQNLTFVASVPFALVIVLMCVSLGKDLRTDPLIRHQERAERVLGISRTRTPPDAADDTAAFPCG